jgi:hypothetical protein
MAEEPAPDSANEGAGSGVPHPRPAAGLVPVVNCLDKAESDRPTPAQRMAR